MAGLKAINDKGAAFGASVRDLATRLKSLANRMSGSDLLGRVLGEPIADTAEARALCAQLLALVPVPDDAAIDAASGGLLDAEDRENCRLVARCEAVVRYVVGYAADLSPCNDV